MHGNPVYLQQVSNVINGLNSNLGRRTRKRNDLVITPRWITSRVRGTACSSA